ncbi:MAG: hypothetical protein M1527_07130 [Gammaproteobacteria bacterium]|nr:hypothetical protein [Gammaproteobacteria bacterium]
MKRWTHLLFAATLAAGIQTARADYVDAWADFSMFAEESDLSWEYLMGDVRMDIGRIKDVYWAVAWREGDEVGVMLKYIYAEPVSPPELPAPGPLQEEEVEVTFHCPNRTSRIHYIYLYNPQGKLFGKWFDPDRQGPESFGPESIIGQAYSRVCH